MSTKIRKNTSEKKIVRFKRKARIRSVLAGTAERPRLTIYRSNKFLYAQIIDDVAGKTLVSASTLEKDLRADTSGNIESAKTLGTLLAKRAKDKSIDKVVFDRAGYIYHGRVKALADAAREAGLKF
jgi:large subunit ribosomal protein L18